MKAVLAPVLWLLALVLALAALWRLRRRGVLVLPASLGASLLRRVVVLLLALGLLRDGRAAEQDEEAPTPDTRPAPAGMLTAKTIAAWREQTSPRVGRPQARLRQILVLLEGRPGGAAADQTVLQEARDLVPLLPDPARALVLLDLDAHGRGQPVPEVGAQRLLAALAGLEAAGHYDAFYLAYLWRRSASLPTKRDPAQRRHLIELYARLHRHARVVNTLVRAHAEVKPVQYVPWMSKAAPPRDVHAREDRLRAELLQAAQRLYLASDTGTWERDGAVEFLVAPGAAPRLLRAGEATTVRPGQTLRLTRLDLLEVPAGEAVVLIHGWLGRIVIPAGTLASVWRLPDWLAAEARQRLDEAVRTALAGDAPAARRLESALPLTQRAVRAGLARTPLGKGAPLLRSILVLFDDSLVSLPQR